jgi:hypothetical protein
MVAGSGSRASAFDLPSHLLFQDTTSSYGRLEAVSSFEPSAAAAHARTAHGEKFAPVRSFDWRKVVFAGWWRNRITSAA